MRITPVHAQALPSWFRQDHPKCQLPETALVVKSGLTPEILPNDLAADFTRETRQVSGRSRSTVKRNSRKRLVRGTRANTRHQQRFRQPS